MVHDAFFDDPRFVTSRDKAFKCIVNDTTVFQLELSSNQVNFVYYTSFNKNLNYIFFFVNLLLPNK